MKRKILNNIIVGVGLSGIIIVSSCDTFESEPYERITEEIVTNPNDSTGQYIHGLFYAIYQNLPDLHNRFQDSYLDAATDNGLPTKDKGGATSLNNYRNGRLSPENIASLDGNAWAKCYTGIRRANLFLQKIADFPNSNKAGGITPETRKYMIAEARAVRAYYYFELIKRWGGVPIVYDQILDLNSNLNIARSSVDDCVKYILDEISPDSPTSCYDDLFDAFSSGGGGSDMWGRVNKGSILGIISRLKLYLASPLFNESGDITKWQEAADAAKRIIDLNIYELHPSFLDLFSTTGGFPNKELLMVKEAGSNTTIETKNSPSGYYNSSIKCYGYTSPSQNLVDAFLTLDGKMINDNTAKYPYDPQNPYENRDPRLGYTVFHNGSQWLKRQVETFEGGQDRRNRPGFFFTLTGYYLRKFSQNAENATNFQGFRHHNYIIRYAEILLNYAEALNEVDPAANKAEIEKTLTTIRRRAGIEAGEDNRYGLPSSYTKEEMRKIIRNERRIELAFEDHRFWDIRRWKIADREEAVMQNPVNGVVITKQTDGTLHYDYVPVYTSTFDSYMYLYPIPRGQMQSNNKLVQNPGWNY